MDCIAHRGFAEVAPENTLAAVEYAASAGASVVEVDLRRCASGEIVLVHDERVDRVTGAAGRVADLNSSELAALDVQHGGSGVPTLADVLAADPDAELLLDVKESGLVADALSLADDHGATVRVSAFDPAVVREAVAAGAPWVALVAAGELEDARRRALEIGCDGLHPRVSATTDRFVRSTREAGLAVNPWTIGSRADALVVERAGADGSIADAPGYCRWRRRISTESERERCRDE